MRSQKRPHYNEESDGSPGDGRNYKKRVTRSTSSSDSGGNEPLSISSRGRVRRLNPRVVNLLRE